MDWTIGNIPRLDLLKPELVLTFYPQSFPLRWGLCSTTADFCADYLATREPCLTSRDAINYVLNELVENAVKFSEGSAITISLSLQGTRLMLLVTNHVHPRTAARLRDKLHKLLAGDPLELLMRRVEENAENPESEGSGLGFLTMMTDYEARLGWRLISGAGGGAQPLLTTVACLELPSAAGPGSVHATASGATVASARDEGVAADGRASNGPEGRGTDIDRGPGAGETRADTVVAEGTRDDTAATATSSERE